jgi:hypothetical protein
MGFSNLFIACMIIVFLTLLRLLLSVTCAIAALSSFVLLSCVAELVMIK